MNVYKRLEKENRHNLGKIFIPLVPVLAAGYFLYILIDESFFIGWEVYFAAVCYGLILLTLLIIDIKIIRWMYYDIYIEEGKLKIRDGFFIRPVTIPVERLYYISSVKSNGKLEFDSIFITDKRINHKKVRQLGEEEFKGMDKHLEAIRELESLYPEKTFYYYRVFHRGYRFFYYFYMLYRNCDRCKFSDTSMELVKRYAEGR